MKEKYQLHRFWILILIMLAASGFLWFWLIMPGQVVETAGSAPDNTPDPIWHTFILTDEPVFHQPWEGSGIDIYKNYILWAEGDISLGSGTPSCDYPDGTASPTLQPFSQIPTGWSDSDICIFDRHTGLVSHLIDSDDGDTSPAMYGDWVAFDRELVHVPRLFLYNIVTGQEIEVPEADGVSDPAIYGYNLSTGQYMTITNDPYSQSMPDIYENLVVWRDDRHGRWDIYGIDLQTSEIFSVTDGTNPVADIYYPVIWGNVVAWHGPWQDPESGAAAAIKMSDFSFMPLVNNP